MGYTYKKDNNLSRERCQKVEDFKMQLTDFKEFKEIYIYETGVSNAICREYSRVLKGELLKDKKTGKRYQKTLMTSGQMDNKLIAPIIYKDIMCSHFFKMV